MSVLTSSLVPVTILTASILGSPHCAAMCSGLVLAAAPTKRAEGLYHLGRLIGYVLLGALAGLLGKSILSTTTSYAFSWGAAILLSGILIFLGVRQLSRASVHLKMPKFLSSLYALVWQQTFRKRETIHGILAIGFLSSFLPCGWLYSFVLGAAASRSPLGGGISLAIFWIGTLPALSVGPLLIKKIFAPLRAMAPSLSGILLILAGFFTVAMRASPLLEQTAISGPLEATSQPKLLQCCPLHRKK